MMEELRAGLARELASLAAAASFLTRVPLGHWGQVDAVQLARSARYFPLVGALVGAAAALVYGAGVLLWSPPVAVVLALAFGALVTGAFHEDGFADTLDSLGGFDRAQRFAIMKDSRIGSYGAVGLILLLLANFAVLASLPAGDAARALIAAHVLGRWSSLPLLRWSAYVGVDARAGRPFARGVDDTSLVIATALAALLSLLALGSMAPAAWLAAAVVVYGANWYFRRSLGGVTGDCLGAANKVTELVIYLTVAL